MSNLIKSYFIFSGLLIFVFSVISVKSQQPAQTPPANPSNQQEINRQATIQQQQEQRQSERQRQLDIQRRQQEYNNMQMRGVMENSVRLAPEKLRRDIEILYRKTNKKELKTLAINRDEAKKYEAFLKQNKAGLIKLVEDLGCSENQNVVVVTEDCLKYSMPGGGSSYSFRVKDYRIPRLADLTFTDNAFQVTGKLVHGILTGIGDVPLEKVSLQSPGMKYLIDFQPVTKFEDAVLTEKKLERGLTKDEFIYRRTLKAIDNMTYILRSIAYKGELYRAVNGVTYNELDFDKRRDVIIAFRIVSREPDKSVTILWKELENKDSPKMKRKTEGKKEIKENNFVAKEGKL